MPASSAKEVVSVFQSESARMYLVSRWASGGRLAPGRPETREQHAASPSVREQQPIQMATRTKTTPMTPKTLFA